MRPFEPPLENEVVEEIKKIESNGGILRCVEDGMIQKKLIAQAYDKQKKIETKELTKVGVNRFQIDEEDRDLEVFEVDPNTINRQKERLAKIKAERDGKQVQEMLNEVGKAAVKGENMMPYIFNAVKAYATVGEIVKQLKEVYGEASLINAF